jgi:hypothetical protein
LLTGRSTADLTGRSTADLTGRSTADLLLLELTHFNSSKFKIVRKYQWNLIMVYYVNKNSQKD